jgi:L-lactate transport
MYAKWFHNYSAVHNSLGLTALIVSIPIVFLFWALSAKGMKGHVAGLLTLILTIAITVLAYGMPLTAALSAAALGVTNGFIQIGFIILAAVFLYNLTVESGQIEIIKSSISSLSADRRMQALLIAFSFSAFMEGTAGMGAPVAVCAGMLIGIGFPPLPAALICLIGNTQPVPFGPLGVPTLMMSSVTGIDKNILSKAVGLDMVVLAIVVPILMLVVLAGWKGAMGALPAALVAGGSYAVTCFVVSRHIGPELPAIMSSIVSMICLMAFMKFWKPKNVWRFQNDSDVESARVVTSSAGKIIHAWTPFIILMGVMCIWNLPAFKNWAINSAHCVLTISSWPFLDGVVYRSAPIVAQQSKYAASYQWQYLTAASTAIFLAALCSMAVLGMKPASGARVFGKTLNQMRFALTTLASVVGVAYVANYSGMSYTLALALAHYTASLFPLVSPVIGWLGVFLTGSVTSSAVLFGKLQQVTAGQIGANPVLTTSANLAGGVAGKLISPQSLAIACAATGKAGRESEIFRRIWRYSVMLLALVIVLIAFQAYVIPESVPSEVIAVSP